MFQFRKIAAILLVMALIFSVSCNQEETQPESESIAEQYYNVVFLLDESVTLKVKDGETISFGDVPSAWKEGYVFKGWKKEGIDFDFSSAITEDVTLTPEYEKIGGEDENESIRLNAFNGKQMSLLPAAMKEYLESENQSEKAKYLYDYQKNYAEATASKAVRFSWETEEEGEFTLMLSSDETFANATEIKTYEKEVSVYNLIPSEYYWKVVSESGETSKTDTFTVFGDVRAINCGNIVNMRDEGGYTGDFGKIKYGLVYRSADISSANEKAIEVLKDLGIKTEIDLRIGSTTKSPDESINRQNCGIIQWDFIFPNITTTRYFSAQAVGGVKKAFKLLTDEENYPVDFHCSYGADRTGTFAFLLGGLLGMNYEDLASDFEMTSFYQGRRWRSSISVNAGNYFFTSTGVMQDDDNNLVAFGKAYDHVLEEYGNGDGKFSTAIENYLISVVGLERADIEAVRSIMIEGYESEINFIYESEKYFALSQTDGDGNIVHGNYNYTLNDPSVNKVTLGGKELVCDTDYSVDGFGILAVYNSAFEDFVGNIPQTLTVECESEVIVINFDIIATFAVTKASDINSGSTSTNALMMKACGLKDYTNAASDRPCWQGYIVLACDIDFGGADIVNKSMCANAYGGTSWGFMGTFDGLGHTLSNFAVKGTNVSLFGRIDFAGAVKNTRFVGFSTGGQASFGLFDAACFGTLENLYVDGTCEGVGVANGSLLGTLKANNAVSGAKMINCTVYVRKGENSSEEDSGAIGKTSGFLYVKSSVIYTDYTVPQSFIDAGGEVKPLGGN